MKLTIQVEKFLQSIFYLSFNLMTLMHVNMRLILTNIMDHTKCYFYEVVCFPKRELASYYNCNFKLLYASNYKIFTNYFCLYPTVLHQLTQHPGKSLFYPLLWVYLPTKTATNCLRSLIQIVSR